MRAFLPPKNANVDRRGVLVAKLEGLWRRIQLTPLSRHLGLFLRHSTPRRLLNVLIVETEFRLRRTKLIGRPYTVWVDPTTICNLRCPLCPTGTGEHPTTGQMMQWEDFTRIIDELAPYAYRVNLYNWGESLLHPHVFEMIEYCKARNLSTNMSANFNLVRPEQIDGLINSGLDDLLLSVDGASQETYEKYRVRGRLATVVENAKRFIARRNELGSRTPRLEWQFIPMRHNFHEIEQAAALAGEVGADRFKVTVPIIHYDADDKLALKREWFVPAQSGARAEVEDQWEFYGDRIPSACQSMYRNFVVNPDGRTTPCCMIYETDAGFGNLLKQSFSDIWNNEYYQSARALHRKGGKPTVQTICDRCEFFEKHATPYNPLKSASAS
ncbi:MAG: SPASM domain-containing protein [Myxococcales bacterium]|nr:SPASM domain-containing protein [Myxococcales bacterium]